LIWRSKFHSSVVKFVDFLVAGISYIATYFITNLLHNKYPATFPPAIKFGSNYWFIIFISCVLFVVLFDLYKAYSHQRFTSLGREYSIILNVVSLSVIINIVAIYFLKLDDIPRTIFIVFVLISVILFIVEKTFLFFVAAYIRKLAKNRKRVIIVGTGKRSENFINTVNNHFSWGLDIIGIITGQPELIGQEMNGKKILDDYSNFELVLKKYNPEEVIITLSTNKFDEIRKILEECEIQGVQVRINSDFLGKISKNMKIDNVFGINLVSFTLIQQKDIELFIKRILDIIISFIALIVLAPLAFVIGLFIVIQDGFPIHFKWRVVGLNRKPILSWKFRTMVKNADSMKKELMKKNEMNGPAFKMTNDPRILPVGKFLRKYSLDELPQLYSVLKGDLSLVGPRPPLQYEFNEFDNWHRRKLSVKPGITCLWQISGRNDINSFDEWAKLDLEYIDNWSLWLDIKILFKTIPVVLLGKGAK